MTFLIDYVSKICNVCVQKNKNNIKREPCTEIIIEKKKTILF